MQLPWQQAVSFVHEGSSSFGLRNGEYVGQAFHQYPEVVGLPLTDWVGVMESHIITNDLILWSISSITLLFRNEFAIEGFQEDNPMFGVI